MQTRIGLACLSPRPGCTWRCSSPLEEPVLKWKAGTLHASKFDVESNLWFLARRLVPLHALKDKFDGYIDEGLLQAHEKDSYVQFLETMTGVTRDCNLHNPASEMDGTTQTEPGEDNRPLSESDLRQEF